MAVITPGSHTRVQNHTNGAVPMACLRNTILLKHYRYFYEDDYSARILYENSHSVPSLHEDDHSMHTRTFMRTITLEEAYRAQVQHRVRSW